MTQTRSIYTGYQMYPLSDGREQFTFGEEGEARPRTVQLLSRLTDAVKLPPVGRMLDIGCGNGSFLASFAKRHPQWELYGYEQNPQHREAVLSLPGVRGFYKGDLSEIDGTFDLIVMIYVLEHLDHPADTLNQIRSLLSPQGYVLVQVPNALDNPFDMSVIDHFSHFSPPVLRAFVESCGYQIFTPKTGCWIPKEITGLFRLGENSDTSWYAQVRRSEIMDCFKRHAQWLLNVAEQVKRLSAEAPRFGVFGTAIAGTWTGQLLGPGFQFFVDEDAARINKQHLGKPILHPRQLKPDDHVFIAMPPKIAAPLQQRLSKTSQATFYIPQNAVAELAF